MSDSSAARPLTVKDLFASVANFLALGFGAGLSPKAPGTAGTVVGIPVLLLMPNSLGAYTVVLLILFGIGVWCCGASARQLGVHDHGGIVWDEIVGYLITMMAMPRSVWWLLLGFIAFRVFDIWKPWPIGWIDRRVGGGMGIMLDDVAAGIMAAVVMQLVLLATGTV